MLITTGLSLVLLSPAVERQQWAGRFAAMARVLPPLSEGLKPSRAQAYRKFYGLDSIKGFWRLGSVPVANQKIAVQVFRPRAAPSGTVIVVHGYLDHMGSYGPLVRRLLREGYRVVLYDLPGHGLSTGPRADLRAMADYAKAFQAVRRAVDQLPMVPGPTHFVGHSTGASVLLNELDQGRSLAGNVVLLAPLVRWAHFRKSNVAKSVASLFIGSVPRRFRRCSSDQRFMTFLRDQDPLQQRRIPFGWLDALKAWQTGFVAGDRLEKEVLVIQGTVDGTVHWSYNLDVLRRRFPMARFLRIEGADHHLVNERPALKVQTLEAVAEALARPPSTDRLDPGPQRGK